MEGSESRSSRAATPKTRGEPQNRIALTRYVTPLARGRVMMNDAPSRDRTENNLVFDKRGGVPRFVRGVTRRALGADAGLIVFAVILAASTQTVRAQGAAQTVLTNP